MGGSFWGGLLILDPAPTAGLPPAVWPGQLVYCYGVDLVVFALALRWVGRRHAVRPEVVLVMVVALALWGQLADWMTLSEPCRWILVRRGLAYGSAGALCRVATVTMIAGAGYAAARALGCGRRAAGVVGLVFALGTSPWLNLTPDRLWHFGDRAQWRDVWRGLVGQDFTHVGGWLAIAAVSGLAGLALVAAGRWPRRRQVAAGLVWLGLVLLGGAPRLVQQGREERLRQGVGQLVRLSFACQFFVRENNRWPARLSDLVPRYATADMLHPPSIRGEQAAYVYEPPDLFAPEQLGQWAPLIMWDPQTDYNLVFAAYRCGTVSGLERDPRCFPPPPGRPRETHRPVQPAG